MLKHIKKYVLFKD